VLLHECGRGVEVIDVQLLKDEVRALESMSEICLLPQDKIVHPSHPMPGGKKPVDEVAADKSSGACNVTSHLAQRLICALALFQ
jgi:hypothetical protein